MSQNLSSAEVVIVALRVNVMFYVILFYATLFICTVKPVKNGHSQKDQKLVFKTNYPLMQVEIIAECSKGSILQYFQPSLPFVIKSFVLSIFK